MFAPDNRPTYVVFLNLFAYLLTYSFNIKSTILVLGTTNLARWRHSPVLRGIQEVFVPNWEKNSSKYWMPRSTVLVSDATPPSELGRGLISNGVNFSLVLPQINGYNLSAYIFLIFNDDSWDHVPIISLIRNETNKRMRSKTTLQLSQKTHVIIRGVCVTRSANRLILLRGLHHAITLLANGVPTDSTAVRIRQSYVIADERTTLRQKTGTSQTSASETIRKAPIAEAQTVLGKQKK